MNDRGSTLPERDYQRIPGLFRLWELVQVLKPRQRYQLEDGGTLADGTPLLCVFVDENCGGSAPPQLEE